MDWLNVVEYVLSIDQLPDYFYIFDKTQYSSDFLQENIVYSCKCDKKRTYCRTTFRNLSSL